MRTSRDLTRLLILTAFAAVLATPGCTRQEEKHTEAPVVEPVQGMKYYVGGPVMKADKYGRLRLAGFNGEVSGPTTRGLLIGIKVEEDRTFDYRTWLNGLAVSQSEGWLDEEGLLWYTKRFTYDSGGNVIARQQFEYDDERKVMISLLEHVDPDTGAAVKSYRQEMPYTPVEDEDDDLDFDDDEAEETG